MSHQPNFKTSLVALLEAEEEASEAHLADEELLAYHGGDLPTEEMERLREHLVGCRECFEMLRDLESFSAVAPRAPEDPVDFETAAVWRTLGPQLPASERAGAQKGSAEPRAGGGPWQVPLAVAATFVLTMAGVSTWFTSRQSSPRGNIAIVNLIEDTSIRTGQSGRIIDIPRDDETVLILTPELGLDHSEYRVEILDDTSSLVREVTGLQLDPEDETLTFWLPRASLALGAYQVQLYGGEDGVDEQIASYRIQVVEGPP